MKNIKNIEELVNAVKLSELLNKKEDKEPVVADKKENKIVWALAIIGAVAAVAAIAFAVYKYLTPSYLDDDDDFDDDFDEDFYVDDDEKTSETEEQEQEEEEQK